MKTDNFAEYYTKLKLDLTQVLDSLEARKYEDALPVLENILANARLLFVWTKDKVEHEHSVELQRSQNLRSVPKAVPRGEGTS